MVHEIRASDLIPKRKETSNELDKGKEEGD